MQPGKRFLVWLAGFGGLGVLATGLFLPVFACLIGGLQKPR
ncbi:hypothetical protein, partial [Escherichia coli]